jgi:hypothetical protein
MLSSGVDYLIEFIFLLAFYLYWRRWWFVLRSKRVFLIGLEEVDVECRMDLQ